MTITFSAVMKIRGVNPFLLVSASRANIIRPGWRKPLPILLRINGKPSNAWRINMMPVGNGSFYLYLHGDIRKASGTTVGDRVRVEIDFDASYKNGPQHPLPRQFKQALAGDPHAMKNWTALIPSRKKEILRYFSGLNSTEARSRNLARALHVLSGETGRFMGRAWKNGS
jgi:Bacteriocin-protection, YdeI or OmpD-Associated/Domain of unknown function (DUF1905)